jgi:hypothetical protein
MHRIPVDLSGVDATLDRSAARRLADVWDGPGQECPSFGQEQPDPVAEPGPLWPRIRASMVLLAAIAGVMWFQLHDFGRRSQHVGTINGSLRGAGAFARHRSTGDVQMKIQTAASVAAFVVAAASAQAQQAVQWRVEDGGNGHWYLTVRADSVVSWTTASATANGRGGHLATLELPGEDAFVNQVARAQNGWTGLFGPWLGGYVSLEESECDPASWQWVTNSPIQPSSASWCPNQPDCGDERYLHYWYCDGWNNAGESGAYSFGGVCTYLIEWSADCDSDGIVDYGQILRGERPDANTNGVPDGCECIADLNDDGVVQGADLGLMLAAWGSVPAGVAADINRDGAVDGNDLGLLLAGWGPCAP